MRWLADDLLAVEGEDVDLGPLCHPAVVAFLCQFSSLVVDQDVLGNLLGDRWRHAE